MGENVKSVHRGITTEAAIEINDELILIEATTRFVLIDIADGRRINIRGNKVSAVERPNSTSRNPRNESTWQRRIERSRPQQVQSTNVDVACRDSQIVWQRMLNTY